MIKLITRLVATAALTSVMVFGGLMVSSAHAGGAVAAAHINHYGTQSGHEYTVSGTTHGYKEFNHVDVYIGT